MAKRKALYQAMQDAEVTGKELAEALHITEGRFSQILNGDLLREDQIKTLCEMLSICADVIIFDRRHKPADQHEAEFVQLYRHKFNQSQRVRWVQFMRELPDDT